LSLSCAFLSAFSAALTASLSAAANDVMIINSICKANKKILEENNRIEMHNAASQRVKSIIQ
jgi:hypothetical protein